MPLETDSNVIDDAAEQQESHIDLINETTRMKHLTIKEEQKQKQQEDAHGAFTLQEPKIGSSPKA